MRLFILCVCLSMLIFAAACSKDKDKDESHYCFMNDTEFYDFIFAHNWGLDLYVSETGKSNLVVYMYGVWAIDSIMSPDDTYTLKLNNFDVPVTNEDGNPYFNNGEGKILPMTTSIEVVFTRNGTILLNKSVTVPAQPTDIVAPSTWNLAQPMTFSWTLSRNSHTQYVDFYAECDTTYGSNYYDDLYTYLAPSARTLTYPANSLSLDGPLNHGSLRLTQFNFAEYSDNYIMVILSGYYLYNPAKRQLVKADAKDIMNRLPQRPYNHK